MLIRFVSALLLYHAANVSRSDRPTHVDLLELNTYKWPRAALLSKLSPGSGTSSTSVMMQHAFFARTGGRSSIPYRTSRHKWRFMNRSPFDASKAVHFEADDFIMTETSYDVWQAEMIDKNYRHMNGTWVFDWAKIKSVDDIVRLLKACELHPRPTTSTLSISSRYAN